MSPTLAEQMGHELGAGDDKGPREPLPSCYRSDLWGEPGIVRTPICR